MQGAVLQYCVSVPHLLVSSSPSPLTPHHTPPPFSHLLPLSQLLPSPNSSPLSPSLSHPPFTLLTLLPPLFHPLFSSPPSLPPSLQTGSALVSSGHHKGQEIDEVVQTLCQEWKQLEAASAKKCEWKCSSPCREVGGVTPMGGTNVWHIISW